MKKRAAIYIRVSSEKQADKVSPQAQESDCRAYAAERGYSVVEVYRDTERYRVGRRLVEPSGTRPDRPGLRRMMADADADAFDIILAWREDRLYRGLRPMLDLLECIERNRIDIELAKETFDRKMAGIKASIAKMELDAKSERTHMGIAGRLAEGKVWNTGIAYGYHKAGDAWEVVPDEARWVRQIFEWYTDGVSVRDIRWCLVEASVPQKTRAADAEGYAWEHCVIYAILRHDFYATGVKLIKWDGETYELAVPPIIPFELWQAARLRCERQRRHPANHRKFDYLGLGLTYCAACGWKMSATSRRRYWKGQPTDTRYAAYLCKLHQRGYAKKPDCVKSMTQPSLDGQLWAKVWAFISDDQRFTELVRARVDFLRSQENDAGAEVERLQRALDGLTMERQKVITYWRKGKMTDADYDMQLGALTIEQAGLNRALADKALLLENRADKVLALANEVRAELRAGGDWLNDEPASPEEARRQFEFRRRVVELIVTRVNVQADKTLLVDFELDVFGRAHIENTPPRSHTAN